MSERAASATAAGAPASCSTSQVSARAAAAISGVASTTRFVRMVGPARAKEIIMDCRRYSAEEARQWGLVNRVVPGTDVMKAAREYAEFMAKKPFKPLAEMKARINAVTRAGMPEVNAMTEGFLERS